jgi:hypothetical protein
MVDRETFEPEARLRELKEKNAAVLWPLAIDLRLEQLKERVESAGENTSRKELAAAILLAAPEDPTKLAKLLKRYRLARARDAHVGPVAADNVISMERRKPGPRPRTARSG